MCLSAVWEYQSEQEIPEGGAGIGREKMKGKTVRRTDLEIVQERQPF